MFHGGCRALDVGCGVGAASIFANDTKYFGIDLSKTLVHQGRMQYSLPLAVADVTRLPFRNSSFDRVLCMGVLHHLSEDQMETALREILRVLEIGGEIAINEPNPLNVWNRLLAHLRAPERGILHTKASILRRLFKKFPELETTAFQYEHTMFWPAQLTFIFRQWSCVTSPQVTRMIMMIHRLSLYITPPPLRSHTFWRLKKRLTL